VDNDPAVRLQWAYKIDPSLVLPLKELPPSIADGASLAALNLKRGNLPTYAIASGQDFARALNEPELAADDLMVRVKNADGSFSFQSIAKADPRFLTDTPLWFYVLAEAQAPLQDALIQAHGASDIPEEELLNGAGARTQLGWVGGRIVAEVFYGLLDSDPDSFVNRAPQGWQPILGGDNTLIIRNLLRLADPGKA
jgi:hypothetical protein